MKRTILAASGLLFAGVLAAQEMEMPFGTPDDAAFAARLWATMTEARMVGPNAIRTQPYPGVEPHGALLENFFTTGMVDGHDGALIVKRNYGPMDVTIEQVQTDAASHLMAITVMFRREAGYDADNGDWFWAKYLPDGSLDAMPNGMVLAGRVAKGMDQGCIACHAAAPGEDFVFSSDSNF